MNAIIMLYVPCPNEKIARSIGKKLLSLRLAACIQISQKIESLYLWPPKSKKVTSSKEWILYIKTIHTKWNQIEKEISKIHPYDTPCILEIPIRRTSKRYKQWIENELITTEHIKK